MHAAARNFIAQHAPDCEGPVLEIGSRDINGSIRSLFPEDGYYGIDLIAGPGVDEVIDVVDLDDDETYTTVVSCEVLEHSDRWRDIIAKSHTLLVDGGVLLVTAAGPGRSPHSGYDGSGTLQPDEHYENIDPLDLDEALEDAGFTTWEVDVEGSDVRAKAVK